MIVNKQKKNNTRILGQSDGYRGDEANSSQAKLAPAELSSTCLTQTACRFFYCCRSQLLLLLLLGLLLLLSCFIVVSVSVVQDLGNLMAGQNSIHA